MPKPKRDMIRFVVHQRDNDPTEIVAHLVKDGEDCDKVCEQMKENGYSMCESNRSAPVRAMTGEAFYIRLVGDIKVNTFTDNSYRKDRFLVRYIRNRPNRKDFFITGVYRGRYQPEYAGKVLLHRVTLNAGTTNKGSGRQFIMNNLESVLGNIASSSKLVLFKDRDVPAPPDVQETYDDDSLTKDVVLRTISKNIPKDFVTPLCMHLFGLSEVEVLNLGMLPHHRDFDEQRYGVLDKWKGEQGDNATFRKLIEAFQAVKMKSAAATLNRNLLTEGRLRRVAKHLPGDCQPLADAMKVNLDEVKEKFYTEMAEFKFQIIWRWREDTHKKLRGRANHSLLLRALRYISLPQVAEEVTDMTSVDVRDIVMLRTVTKDMSREKICALVDRFGLTDDEKREITREYGLDFNKRLYLLNALVKWKEKGGDEDSRASYENLMAHMEDLGFEQNPAILDEVLIDDKRLRHIATLIPTDSMQALADELHVDTAPMKIPAGKESALLGYRLLSRWKETRGKYASHTELISALDKAELGSAVDVIDRLGSVDISKGAMSEFCLRYVGSWVHVSRAHEWPSIVQNIPSQLIDGLDDRTVAQIKREYRDPQEQLSRALVLCRDRRVISSKGALCNRLIACGFESAALTLLDVSRSQYYCTTLRLDEGPYGGIEGVGSEYPEEEEEGHEVEEEAE
ncbi:uncharacterized protein LOC129282178 [Lytechinus pictus]|uniref:uncharacterized protein LOC129282178 n=1 Tax=Lytechinus pictus TaxID=7653 RepID=UPI0030BA169D